MEIRATGFPGVVLWQAPLACDERGSFERIWSMDCLRESGLQLEIAQVSVASNHRAGTIRGLHYSVEPDAETKFLRCQTGSMYDVVVDIRPDSAHCGKFLSFELVAGDGLTLCIPPGYAHGYQTLTDNTNVIYLIDRPYVARSARTIRFNDPHIGIPWPLHPTCVAVRDVEAPLFQESV